MLADVEGRRPPVLPELDSSQTGLAAIGDEQNDATGRVVALGLLIGAISVGSWVMPDASARHHRARVTDPRAIGPGPPLNAR